MVAVASPAAKTRVKASPPPVTKAAENSAIAQITHRLTGTTGAMIDAIWAVREEKRELEAQVKELNAKLADYELQLDVKMAKEGVDKATGKSASASFSAPVETGCRCRGSG